MPTSTDSPLSRPQPRCVECATTSRLLWPIPGHESGAVICGRCASVRGLAFCVDTHEYVPVEDAFYADDAGDYYASDETLYWDADREMWLTSEPEEEPDPAPMLRSYGTNVLHVLGWPSNVPSDALCFGVELEMEPARGYHQDDVVNALADVPQCILKEDGSLDSGVELVTLPLTLELHKSQFDWHRTLRKVQSLAKSGAGTSNCGMHVHVNRRALSALTIGKILVFLNGAHNGGFVHAVAQRSNSSYARRDTGKTLADIHSSSRYDMLNVSGGSTIEFRLFRGNLRPERVLKNLEFCHAIVRFCENSGIKRAARYEAFLEFLAKRSAEYPHLCAFLTEKGYAPAPMTAETDATPVAALTDL